MSILDKPDDNFP